MTNTTTTGTTGSNTTGTVQLPNLPALSAQGWICPVCSRGVAPSATWCPCRPAPAPWTSPWTITYGTGTVLCGGSTAAVGC